MTPTSEQGDLFALLHSRTNVLMPSRTGTRTGAGFTYWNGEPEKSTPRFFTSMRNAHLARQAWVKGEHFFDYDAVTGDSTGIDVRSKGRKLSDLRIVRFLLERDSFFLDPYQKEPSE